MESTKYGRQLRLINQETGRRLKIYAAARETSIEKLADQILQQWLDEQPPVGGREASYAAS
jgi:plasmid stability protein